MVRIAVDSDIFFYAVLDHNRDSLRKKGVFPTQIKKFLDHASSHPQVKLCIPVSVFAEIVSLCIHGEQEGEQERNFSINDLYKLVDFWKGLNLVVLHPNKAVATACYNLYMDDTMRDSRLGPSDLVHLGYALAYDLDYFITSDGPLKKYQVPNTFKLKINHPKNADKIF